MKKKLEADLISIAHRILKLKNKSDLLQLHQETQKLYEKLSVLKFVEENFGDVKPTIGLKEIEEKLETSFDEKEEAIVAETPKVSNEVFDVVNETTEPELKQGFENQEVAEEKQEIISEEQPEEENNEPVQEEEIEEEPKVEIQESETTTEPEAEKEPEFEPLFEITKEEEKPVETIVEEPVAAKESPRQISFEDLMGHNYSEPIFEKVSSIKNTVEETPVFEEKQEEKIEEPAIDFVKPEVEKEEPLSEISIDKHEYDQKPVSLNDIHSKTISFGLNDKIGFEKQLFGGSSEDMNRVISQLSTFNTFYEAKEFIEDMVKPDYNNWEGKEEYENRFMEIIEKKFS